jgi:hypothetical protein
MYSPRTPFSVIPKRRASPERQLPELDEAFFLSEFSTIGAITSRTTDE